MQQRKPDPNGSFQQRKPDPNGLTQKIYNMDTQLLDNATTQA